MCADLWLCTPVGPLVSRLLVNLHHTYTLPGFSCAALNICGAWVLSDKHGHHGTPNGCASHASACWGLRGGMLLGLCFYAVWCPGLRHDANACCGAVMTGWCVDGGGGGFLVVVALC